MTTLEAAIRQIRTARLYTKDMLRQLDDDDWFRQPHEGITHIAWQVGHIAVAKYGLELKYLRGEADGDADLISPEFLKQFGRGSVPVTEPMAYPSMSHIQSVLDCVHEQVLREVCELAEDVLNDPIDGPPHPMLITRLGALHWCAQHEFIHAGQIGLLRRLLGAEPLR